MINLTNTHTHTTKHNIQNIYNIYNYNTKFYSYNSIEIIEYTDKKSLREEK